MVEEIFMKLCKYMDIVQIVCVVKITENCFSIS